MPIIFKEHAKRDILIVKMVNEAQAVEEYA